MKLPDIYSAGTWIAAPGLILIGFQAAASEATIAGANSQANGGMMAWSIVASLVGAISIFLRWWLPKQAELYERQVERERTVFSEQLSAEREVFRSGIERVCATFATSLNDLKTSESAVADEIHGLRRAVEQKNGAIQ